MSDSNSGTVCRHCGKSDSDGDHFRVGVRYSMGDGFHKFEPVPPEQPPASPLPNQPMPPWSERTDKWLLEKAGLYDPRPGVQQSELYREMLRRMSSHLQPKSGTTWRANKIRRRDATKIQKKK